MATYPSPLSLSHQMLQRNSNEPMRFGAPSFGEFLEQARNAATITQQKLVTTTNEIITKNNEHLPQKNRVQTLERRIYGKLERNERYPDFEELEPLYQALFKLLEEPFSESERERYLALAQARIGTRKKAPKKGRMPTSDDWQNLRRKLIAFDERHASGHGVRYVGKTPYLLPVPTSDAPQIRLSQRLVSLLKFDTNSIIERERYVEEVMQLWDQGKRLVVTKALSGTGKTRAFYVLLKHIARMQNHWPFYYVFKRSSESQTPDDYLNTFLSVFYTDLHLSSPEDEQLPQEERIERIFTELTRCSEHGLHLAILLDDAHLLLEPASGKLSESWQRFLDLWIAREHTAILCVATREWPHWRGRDRSFVKEIELAPLSPQGGTAIWKRFGFEDVEDLLLEEASRKCGCYPQWIELRASDLDEPGHLFLWPGQGKALFTNENADNQHTERIKAWLLEETIFDAVTDASAREELTHVFSRQLSAPVQYVLDLLATSPLGVPFPLLEQEVNRPALAIDELMRCSLIDRESLEQGRVALVSLVREARLHQLSKEQRGQLEQQVTDLYTRWLYDLQEYQDDAEQAALIAELVILYVKQHRFLEAGELLVTYGWLCAQLGHMSHIERYTSTVRLFSNSFLEEEDGRTLLHYRVKSLIGQKVNEAEQERTFRRIYTQAIAGKIHLRPHTEIYITHEMLVSEIQAGRYERGQSLLEETLAHIAQSSQISAEVRALWNQSKARLLARWGEAEERKGNYEKALALREDSMRLMNETLALWEECLSSASPLNTKRLEFKLGRAYNDYAYRLRLSGRITEAYHAIRKCLEFKQEKQAARKRSLAVAIGEYALILAAMGQLLQADEENAKALGIQQDLLQRGENSITTDIGMLLVERGTIFMQQARTLEARPLFADGIRLIGESNSRRKYRDEAEKQIRIIDTSPHYYLDEKWAERYLRLARYDDTEWLSSAGPFSDEEEHEWATLFAGRPEGEAKARMEAIMLQSRQRELKQCFEEQREPRLHYPTISIATVEEHITGFKQLLAEITSGEQHAIVRRLYQEGIQEHLSYLHMYKAIAQKECDRVWHYNQQLFGIPSREEMEIALLPLVRMLVGAQAHSEVGTIAANLLVQIKTWNLHQDIFIPKGGEQNAPKEKSRAVKPFDKKMVTPEIAKRFFEDILYSLYHFRDWEVCISPTRSMAHVEPNLRRIILPQQEYSIEKLRGLLQEEVGTHVFRAEAGYASPIMLLGSGTARYKYTEEALAIHARGEQANPKKSWLGTLAAGLMAGVVNPPFTFSALVLFLKKAFLVRNIITKQYETYAEAEKAAKVEALERGERGVRGITDLTQPGMCCLLDRVYLKGHLDLSEFLKKGGDIQRLLVGKIGIADLPYMEQIHLLKPTIQYHHLAEQVDIYSHIRKIEERSIAGYRADNV